MLHLTKTKMIFKKLDGIYYYSDKIDNTGKLAYRLWESKTHKSYSHWTKIKTNKNQ